MASRRLLVEIIGDPRSFQRSLRTASSSATQFSTGVGAGLAKGVIGFGLVATGALVAGRAVRASFEEFSEMQKVVAQTNAVLKSTGATANVTGQHVQDLAKQILNYSGIDDEAIAAGENLLLTFKNIRNEAGQGNAIFDRATRAAADLSVAWGTDMHGAAIKLGKAINDPVRGITALQRVGIQFTEAQRTTIKTLVETGRTLEAQRIILAEVESQVGGSARAFGDTLPGQVAKAREQLRNLGGNLVNELAPGLSKALGLTIKLVHGFEKLGDASSNLNAFLRQHRLGFLALEGGSINIPRGTTAAELRKVRDEFAAVAGEGDLMTKAFDAAIAKLQEMAPAALKATSALSKLEALRSGRFDTPARVAEEAKKPTRPDPFVLPGPLRLAQAQARLTKSVSDDVNVAQRIVAKIRDLIEGGKLKGQRLIDALGDLAAAQDFIRSAQEDAARKTTDAQKAAAQKSAEAQKKHADAVKAAAEKQRAAAQEAAQRIRDATDQARAEIGTLFAGPVLNPTDAARKAALGVPGPDPTKILADIRAQSVQALRFERDLRRLRRLGVGGKTIEELRGQGTAAIPNIEAILNAPRGLRANLVRSLIGRERTAQRIGQMIVHTPKVTLHAKQVVLAGGGGPRTTQNSRSGRYAGN